MKTQPRFSESLRILKIEVAALDAKIRNATDEMQGKQFFVAANQARIAELTTQRSAILAEIEMLKGAK